MYEFRTKLQHNMTLCQGLLPADFELNHLAKWVLSAGEERLFEIILMASWDLCAALLLMRSRFAWSVIKPSALVHYEIGNVSFVITNGFFFKG